MKIYLQKTSGEKSCVDQIENGNPPFDDVFKALTRTSVRAKMLDDLNVTTKAKDRTVRRVTIYFGEDSSSIADRRCDISITRHLADHPEQPFELVLFIEENTSRHSTCAFQQWFLMERLTETELLRFTVEPKILIQRIEEKYPDQTKYLKSIQSWNSIYHEDTDQ